MNPDTQRQTSFQTDVAVELEKIFQIVVWNDEVNTFEWVIDTLIDICGHTEEQAEQCALIIHTNGKYAVQQGSFDHLNPRREAIVDRGIGATIEELAV